MNIIELSIKRPVLVTMFILFLIVMGVFSYNNLTLEMLPKVDTPIVTVVTVYKGAGPREIETLISKKIEEAVSSINGIDTLRSNSYEGYSNVIIQFKTSVKTDIAAADVKDKISAIRGDLPADADEPIILKLDINALPVLNIAITGDRPVPSIYAIAKDYIKDNLSNVDGVASISFLGARERQIEILITQDTLKEYNMSILSLSGLIGQKSLNIPSGHITQTRKEYSIRMDGEFKSVDEIRNINITLPNAKTVRLDDIADVRDTHEELRQIVTVNKQPCVGISVQKRADANTVNTVKAVKKRLDELKSKLPSDITLQITKDGSTFIVDSVNDLNSNLLIGIAITAFIIYLFLHSIKGTIIAAVSIPVSIVTSYFLMYFAGFSMNMLTLMALAISVGVLVNDAILVLENIYVHLGLGKSPKEAAKDGTNEIIVPVLGTTLAHVVIFVPIAFMQGMVGKMFFEFGITVTFATAVSLVVAATMSPMLAGQFLSLNDIDENKKSKFAKVWDHGMAKINHKYKELLGFCMNHKTLVLLFSIGFTLLSFILVPFLGFEFFTESDQREFSISVKMPAGSSLENTNKVFDQIGDIMGRHSEVSMLYKKLGIIESSGKKGINLGEINVKIRKEAHIPTKKVIASITPELAKIPDAEITIKESSISPRSEAPIQVDITGNDLEKLKRVADQVLNMTKSIEGAVDVTSSFEQGKPEVKITPYRDRLARYGITEAYLALSMRSYFEGSISTKYREGDNEYDIICKLDENIRQDIDNIRSLNIITSSGISVPLVDIAQIEESTGPAEITRKERSKAITISANARGKSAGDIITEMQRRLKKIELPAGCNVAFGGMTKIMNESFGSLFTAMLMAIVFTYITLAALLESFIHPFTILFSFPLAFAGIFIALFVTGKTISIFSLMAIVMLIGIVVNNGILLIEKIEVLREEGLDCYSAVMEGCPNRLRPIIMTAVTAIGAMIPQSLGLGEGGELRASMAIVSIGGLVASTVLSMFVIPVVYYIVETKIKRVNL